ncbi:MAG: hypothetical protein BGO40_00610 [Chryseobacterium sp. 39-10]|nr:hypothetical protein [Chryseobacterium sp.]OJV49379.1 MAG: hypothetical protein BGO40_00610 [Chryseobacterium sp. 39-10]
MKKILLYLAFLSVAVVSCKRDETPEEQPEISVEMQNTYDDQAAEDFLQTHYLDAKGNIKDLAATDTVNVKLKNLNPITLSSGVIYIIRNNAQPTPGTAIQPKDIIRLMSSSISYSSGEVNGKVSYQNGVSFRNTIATTGVPEVDPNYYYIKSSLLNAFNKRYNTSYDHSFFEIEGFQEGLQKFKAFDIGDDVAYNLQGVIIVPSRAAYARDPHYSTGISLRNRSFVFAVQVYKTTTRPESEY